MKPFRSYVMLVALAGVLVSSACEQEGPQPTGTEIVRTVNALDALRVTIYDVEDPYTSILRSEGTLQLCADGESYDVDVVRGREPVPSNCEGFSVDYVHHEGSFPHADATINGTAYRANEVHLVRRNGDWLVYLEGSHDESVVQELFGVVFDVVPGDEIRLASRCSGHTVGIYEDDYPLYECIDTVLDSLDFALVRWAEDDSCSLDYSVCPTTG